MSKEKEERDIVFISHATPYDNAFSIWLASRLSLAGYNVWCDQEKLIGGEDFWNDIQRTIRSKAVKMVLVVSNHTFNGDGTLRDGIAKEVALAEILKKSLPDEYFLIPVRIDNVDFSEFSVEFLRLNGIDAKDNWSTALKNLLKVFERDGVPKRGQKHPNLEEWQKVQETLSKEASSISEKIQSNWFEITNHPKFINFYEVKRTLSKPSEIRSIASECVVPCSHHGRLLVSFAELDELQTALGDGIPIANRGKLSLGDFLEGKTEEILGIKRFDARNKITSIYRQAFENFIQNLKLNKYEMASGNNAWWFPSDCVEDDQIHYIDINGKARRRAVKGTFRKKDGPKDTVIPRYYWHLGFTAKPRLAELSHFAIMPRIVITEDGVTPLANKTRMNSVRRSLTKMWFNEKWRGLVLALGSWLANGSNFIELPLSANEVLTLKAQPLVYFSNFGIGSDPTNLDSSDDELEEFERQESLRRQDDPAYYTLDNEEVDDVSS